MSLIQAVTNGPYPNRIQLRLLGVSGPLVSDEFGEFDPRRDLTIYNNGELVTVTSFVFDAPNNRYLLFTKNTLNKTLPIQLTHHVNGLPFHQAPPSLLVYKLAVTHGTPQAGVPTPFTVTALDVNNSPVTNLVLTTDSFEVRDTAGFYLDTDNLVWNSGVGTFDLGSVPGGVRVIEFFIDGVRKVTDPPEIFLDFGWIPV